MIHLEITDSPDAEILGSFKYHQNLLYIGSKDGHVVIRDNSVTSSHLMIEVIEQQLLVHPQKDVSHYLINGKRATSIRKIQVGQKLTIGKTTICIVDFHLTPFPSKKQILDDKLARLVEEESPRLQVIEKLAQLLKS